MPTNPPPPANAADRLDSWKEIASYLRRDVRTVQRWEKKEALPVYRHQHDKLGSVYAFRPELDAWFSSRLQSTASGAVLEPAATDGKLKMAVLPFGNLNSDPEQDYFSDGLTEEMITQITRLQPEHLAVIALSTAMHYKASNKPLEQIKNELGVDYILQGRVRRAAERVRITAQLVEVEDQTQLWAETYERDLRDILSVQTDIAESIAREIHLRITRPAQRSSDKRVNPSAYENYLKGRYHLHGMTPLLFRKVFASLKRRFRKMKATRLLMRRWRMLMDCWPSHLLTCCLRVTPCLKLRPRPSSQWNWTSRCQTRTPHRVWCAIIITGTGKARSKATAVRSN